MRATRLRALALAGCCCQLIVTVGVPLMQFFLVFGASMAYMHIVIVTGTCALLAGCLGLASALSSGPVMPILHVIVSITVAALMGSFNTQTYLDLSFRCNLSQAATCPRPQMLATCACAASSTCTTAQLAEPGCLGCHALGTDFCARSGTWQVLLLPYTGLIEAVLLALPAVFSLLMLMPAAAGSSCRVSPGDVEAGRQKQCTDGGRVAVTAWVDERPSMQEDWPMTTATPPGMMIGLLPGDNCQGAATQVNQSASSSSRSNRQEQQQQPSVGEQLPAEVVQYSAYDAAGEYSYAGGGCEPLLAADQAGSGADYQAGLGMVQQQISYWEGAREPAAKLKAKKKKKQLEGGIVQ